MISAHGYQDQTGGCAIIGGGWQRWGHNMGGGRWAEVTGTPPPPPPSRRVQNILKTRTQLHHPYSSPWNVLLGAGTFESGASFKTGHQVFCSLCLHLSGAGFLRPLA